MTHDPNDEPRRSRDHAEHTTEEWQAYADSYARLPPPPPDDDAEAMAAWQELRTRYVHLRIQEFIRRRADLLRRLADEWEGFAETVDILSDPQEAVETLRAIQEAEGEGLTLTKEEALERWVHRERRDRLVKEVLEEDRDVLNRLADGQTDEEE